MDAVPADSVSARCGHSELPKFRRDVEQPILSGRDSV